MVLIVILVATKRDFRVIPSNTLLFVELMTACFRLKWQFWSFCALRSAQYIRYIVRTWPLDHEGMVLHQMANKTVVFTVTSSFSSCRLQQTASHQSTFDIVESVMEHHFMLENWYGWMGNGENQGRKRRKGLVGETSTAEKIWGHVMSWDLGSCDVLRLGVFRVKRWRAWKWPGWIWWTWLEPRSYHTMTLYCLSLILQSDVVTTRW